MGVGGNIDTSGVRVVVVELGVGAVVLRFTSPGEAETNAAWTASTRRAIVFMSLQIGETVMCNVKPPLGSRTLRPDFIYNIEMHGLDVRRREHFVGRQLAPQYIASAACP